MNDSHGLLGRWFLALSLASSLLAPRPAAGQAPDAEEAGTAEERRIPISQWLILGPVNTPLPAFHDGPEHPFGLGELVERWSLPPGEVRPVRDSAVAWSGGLRPRSPIMHSCAKMHRGRDVDTIHPPPRIGLCRNHARGAIEGE